MIKNFTTGLFISVACLFGVEMLHAQAQNHSLDSLLNTYNFKAAKKSVATTTYDSEDLKLLELGQIYASEKIVDSAFYYLLKIDTTSVSGIQKGRFYNYLAETYDANNEEDIAFSLYENARKHYMASRDLKKANEMLLNLYKTVAYQDFYTYPKEGFLKEFEMVATENNFYDQLVSAYLSNTLLHFTLEGRDSVNFYIDKALYYSAKEDDDLKESLIYSYKGLYFAEISSELDSANYYYQKEFSMIKDKNISYRLFYNYYNQANVKRKQKRFLEAIALLHKADSIPQSIYKKNNKKILYKQLSNDYENIGNETQALYFIKQHLLYRDTINITAQNVNLTKFQAEKKEKENTKLQTEIGKKRQEQRNLWIGAISFLGIGSLLAYLLVKNTKRKQRIAEQQREIEIRKTEKILKEQELTTIDAMISGQEKERQRLASDLHDSVGATLAAAKLQFDHLKTHKNKLENLDQIFNTTGNLLDQAYQEVRTMAHLKNSGVLAKNGLLPAIKKLAENASVANNLTIEVQDFGLDERLENSLEITIFRCIQELVTNIIKHANASEASISITNHEDSLSIIIEDNGDGFNTRNIQKKEGMGLASIEKRIEHLEGTMEIDSTQGKGTSILLDIPL